MFPSTARQATTATWYSQGFQFNKTQRFQIDLHITRALRGTMQHVAHTRKLLINSHALLGLLCKVRSINRRWRPLIASSPMVSSNHPRNQKKVSADMFLGPPVQRPEASPAFVTFPAPSLRGYVPLSPWHCKHMRVNQDRAERPSFWVIF